MIFPGQVLTYGEGGDYQARNISYNSTGYGAFDLVKHGNTIGHFQLSVPGSHNISNALAALAMADLLQIPVDVMQKGLLEFGGTDRRFEKKGEIGGVTIIDDYAHHPQRSAPP